jgi:uncharacterized membrane protein
MQELLGKRRVCIYVCVCLCVCVRKFVSVCGREEFGGCVMHLSVCVCILVWLRLPTGACP